MTNTKRICTKRIWSNEKVLGQLFMLRIKAVAAGNAKYAKVLSNVITRVEIEVESAELFGA